MTARTDADMKNINGDVEKDSKQGKRSQKSVRSSEKPGKVSRLSGDAKKANGRKTEAVKGSGAKSPTKE